VLLTNRCDSRCVTCDIWRIDDFSRELAPAEWRRVAGEIRGLGISRVAVAGGEPLSHPHLVEILRGFKAEGLSVQMTTNGMGLGKKRRDEILATGLDRLTLSVDSHEPALYAKIRGVDALGAVLRNLNALVATVPRDFQVETNSVLSALNLASFADTIEFLLALGVDRVNVNAVTAGGDSNLLGADKPALLPTDEPLIHRAIDRLLFLKRNHTNFGSTSEYLEGMRDYFLHAPRPGRPCFAGDLSVDIYEDGRVQHCGSVGAVGNVREATLRDIWWGPAATKSRLEIRDGNCPGCYASCKLEPSIVANPRNLAGAAMERLTTELTSR
jgi:MoaA/NifB/PqqE/SkfB family radical SAM enzyme